MEHSSIVERIVERTVERSAAPAAAQTAGWSKLEGGFAAEDGGRSLAAMAYRDLDAALQLLAERAQYITGASGAMIALRRGEHNDMLCRASAGSNAPELGALFSMEHGFSGESVRTRQLLRCDDAERDSRVNREGCRRLGIASVVVSPILSEQQVLGVFELFSGKPHGFDDHALSALRRLSEMVETAVKYAVAAQTVSEIQEQAAAEEILDPGDEIKIEVETESETILATDDLAAPAGKEVPTAAASVPVKTEPARPEPPKTAPEGVEPVVAEAPAIEPTRPEMKPAAGPAPKKPLFWSAAQSPANAEPANEAAPVPAGLRNLRKCQACGFPVSQGRTYCVECEEKQWRGQRLPQTEAASGTRKPPAQAAKTKDILAALPSSQASAPIATAAVRANPVSAGGAASAPAKIAVPSAAIAELQAPGSTLFLTSAVRSESWFAANKYILAVLFVVAAVVAGIIWLR